MRLWKLYCHGKSTDVESINDYNYMVSRTNLNYIASSSAVRPVSGLPEMDITKARYCIKERILEQSDCECDYSVFHAYPLSMKCPRM